MPTLPNMSLITPTQGGDSGTWDDKINAAFALIDAHDHTSGKGVQVPIAGIDVDEDLAMGGFFITGLGKLAFTAITAPTTGSKALYVSSADNELYWRTNSGTNVKLTDGTSINTTLVGGIVGDYSSVGAEVAYSDADKGYTFKDESDQWVRLNSGPVRIYEHQSTDSVYVEHAVAAALAAPYTVTWPAALPGAAALVQISAAGVVSFSNTTTENITAAKFFYSTATETIIPSSMWMASGTHTYNTSGYWEWGATASDALYIPVEVVVGETLTDFTVYMSKQSDNTNTVTANFGKRDITTGAFTSIALDTEGGNAIGATTMSPSAFSEVVTAGYYYQIEISASDSTPSAADRFRAAIVTRTKTA